MRFSLEMPNHNIKARGVQLNVKFLKVLFFTIRASTFTDAGVIAAHSF
jgi:hypothetical protein